MIDKLGFDNDLHIIIRFICECQIKHSFIFNNLIKEDVDKCLNYLIKKTLKKKPKRPFSTEKIKSIISSIVNNSINIELIFSEAGPDETFQGHKLDKSIIEKLDNVLSLIV